MWYRRSGIEAEAPYDESVQDEPEATGGAARVQDVSLDVNGGARVLFDKLAPSDKTQVQQTRALEVEMEYADPNGQILTAFTRALLTPSALVVGLAPDGSFFKRDSLRFKAVVLDHAGKPQAARMSVSMRIAARALRIASGCSAGSTRTNRRSRSSG